MAAEGNMKKLFLSGMFLMDIATIVFLGNIFVFDGIGYIYFIAGILFGLGVVLTLVYISRLKKEKDNNTDGNPISE
jgi:hypothetical protein